jgi:phosphoserine phosphatase RsbU/P
MANLQAAVHVALSADMHLPDLAARINRLVCRNTASNVFITAILGTLDTNTGMIEYVSAGHPAPIVLDRHGARVPDHENSLPLGIEPAEHYEVWRIEPTEKPRAVLFYTDGLYEAAAPGGKMLTLEPVKHALSTLSDSTPDAVMSTVLSVVRDHLAAGVNADDMTLMALQLGA